MLQVISDNLSLVCMDDDLNGCVNAIEEDLISHPLF